LRGLQWLRRLHTGSINDYASFAVVGLIVTAVGPVQLITGTVMRRSHR
jgi:hypothetical protein